jgi:hypothetical protein
VSRPCHDRVTTTFFPCFCSYCGVPVIGAAVSDDGHPGPFGVVNPVKNEEK